MIKAEKAQEFLKNNARTPLKKINFFEFSDPLKGFGYLIINTSNNYYNPTKTKNTYRALFKMDYISNPWASREGEKLAQLLFGETLAPYIEKTWDLIATTPYQDSYTRRSFRTGAVVNYINKRIAFYQNLYQSCINGYGKLSLSQFFQYDCYGSYYHQSAYVLTTILETEDPEIETLVENILLNEDEIGGVSRNIIKGLLLSSKPQHWELVSKSLLAAQRQEGLRQTILESLDECNTDALLYIMNVILEHDLMRFSSVIRAVDTWFGFGWEAPKKSTIKRVLENAILFIENPDKISEALKSNDNLIVYIALWVMALKEVDDANWEAISLIKNGIKEKKILAAMFIVETGRSNTELVSWLESNLGNDIEIDYWVLAASPNFKISATLFNTIKKLGEITPTKGKNVKGQVFSWTNYTIKPDFFYNFLIAIADEDQLKDLGKDITLIPSEIREQYFRKIFPKHYTYSYSYGKKDNIPALNLSKDPWKKNIVYQAIKDRNESVMATGIRIFESIKLNEDDLYFLGQLLSRKHKNLRGAIYNLIYKQKDSVFQEIVSNLLIEKKLNQRLAGLELLTIAHEKNKFPDFIESQISNFKKYSKLSKNEEVFLKKFSNTAPELSFKNGFNVIDYTALSPLIKPQLKFKQPSILDKLNLTSNSTFLYKNLISPKKIKTQLNELIALFKKHKNFEYEVTKSDGGKDFVILENRIDLTDYKAYKLSSKEQLNYLPLTKVWQKWYQDSNINDFELVIALHFCENYNSLYTHHEKYVPFIKQYIPKIEGLNFDINHYWDSIQKKIFTILQFIASAHLDHEMILKFSLDQFEDMMARIPESLRKLKEKNNQWSNEYTYWCDIITNSSIYNQIGLFGITEGSTTDLKRLWDLQMYLTASKINHPKPTKSITEIAKLGPVHDSLPTPDAILTLVLFKRNSISKDDVLYQCLLNPELLRLLEGGDSYRYKDIPKSFYPKNLLVELKSNLLKIELERGDLATEATPYISNLGTIEGINYLFKLQERLGRETLYRGYYWGYDQTKKTVLSALIKRSIPKAAETYSDFVIQANDSKISKKRWVELAMYAPQWAEWIGEFINLKKLEDAVWWFHAHASDYSTAEKETIIARYSAVDLQDFKRGAIDIDWFHKIYKPIGKQNWKLLHDASKYISDGNGHRQVKLYSGVMLGEIKIRETLEKIKNKRDKDYVKALGLIPLSKTIPEKDLLNRYNLLQEFLKESKQFGAQRQESEKNAATIGLDNLARNAGFEDSIRFSWAMEGKATQQIMQNAKLEFDDTLIYLQINSNGKPEIIINKNGKIQKTIPAKYKKLKEVKELAAGKTYLNKQFSRTRISLENAMVREEIFSAEELIKIMEHPIVKVMLSKLVLFNPSNKQSGFWVNGKIKTVDNTLVDISKKDSFLIAHPAHLYEIVLWDLYQKKAFTEGLVQPFKQIFRELYVITKNELEKGTKSERYQGHQIQPQKTIALLRSRGWTVNHEEGLQKVYHKKGFIATIYAMADWFSPADMEAPTLEYVVFHDKKTYKEIALKDIDKVTFCEVMRDVDLVVSVAHVGDVDPEASHSTMEMRAVLAKESARLFKLSNVTIKQRNILIQGKLADYSIHLGSGIVNKNGLRLGIIPVHSQHRGRIFLPFLDSDPKSSEIISKMKLLAQDDKIKDPTILAQINS